MHDNKGPIKARRSNKKRMSHYSRVVIRWLIFCFPAGLLMMWSSRCRWSRWLKSTISAVICLLIVAVTMPQTLPPERAKGGVQIVSIDGAMIPQGPMPQGNALFAEDEEDIGNYVQPTTLLAQPTPTPIPVYVYCNDGGKNYHSQHCRYVKKTSSRVTLRQALTVGFTRCQLCDAPSESEYT